MENQHKKIKGYRDLSQEEIDGINKIKEKGVELETLIFEINELMPDPRWFAIAKTDLQTGLMALVRSIAKPESF